ncbi:DUF3073 domain-containing protein [Helcobacillus massiliensis]|uniref:DUF3073 domain-containing protein n=1 Tax=Helcobacillus massiliensis TaxID=521392 RepID=UPI002955B1FF|nr:DUF3073 domain-containing protein [Helcobacillus massiliensis]WOO92366.1 DUF3073 domain-containing protein [Helcobacillus massiliensis]
MGCGRQKAKQAKIARDLKYYSPETDFSALQRELSGQQSQSSWSDDDDDEYPEQWAEKYSDE